MQTADWIRLIAELFGAGIVGGGIILAMRVSLAVLSTKVDLMADEIKKVADILERLGRLDERFRGVDQRFVGVEDRIGRLETRVDELAHGESFVLPLNRGPYEKS